MISSKSYLTANINGKEAHFVCPNDMSLDEALEANFQHRAYLLGRKQMAVEAQEAAKSTEEQSKEG